MYAVFHNVQTLLSEQIGANELDIRLMGVDLVQSFLYLLGFVVLDSISVVLLTELRFDRP